MKADHEGTLTGLGLFSGIVVAVAIYFEKSLISTRDQAAAVLGFLY